MTTLLLVGLLVLGFFGVCVPLGLRPDGDLIKWGVFAGWLLVFIGALICLIKGGNPFKKQQP